MNALDTLVKVDVIEHHGQKYGGTGQRHERPDRDRTTTGQHKYGVLRVEEPDDESVIQVLARTLPMGEPDLGSWNPH